MKKKESKGASKVKDEFLPGKPYQTALGLSMLVVNEKKKKK